MWPWGLVVIVLSGAAILAVNASLISRIFTGLPGRRYSDTLAHAYLATIANIAVLFVLWAATSRGIGAAAWLLLAWAAPTLAVLTQIIGFPGSRLWRPSS
jgi:hypothetical protein